MPHRDILREHLIAESKALREDVDSCFACAHCQEASDKAHVFEAATRQLMRLLEDCEKQRDELRKALTEVRHDDTGGCPLPEAPWDRDPGCPACQALQANGDDT